MAAMHPRRHRIRTASLQVHPNIIGSGKREALDGVKETFQRGNSADRNHEDRDPAPGQDWRTGGGAEPSIGKRGSEARDVKP